MRHTAHGLLMFLVVSLLVVSLSWAAGSLQGSRVTPFADVTVTGAATLVRAANASRFTLSCTNTHASVSVRWGSSAVTAAVGQQFKAGTSIEIRNTAAVYMISEGANVVVSCTEEMT